jgi:hypothetical protein
MTAAGVHQAAPGAMPARVAGPGRGWLRLAWLYLVSRRVPAAAGLLAGFGALLWAALHWRWSVSGGPAAAIVIPLAIEAGAAAVIAVTTYGPFGEPERATGRWLPFLRLGAAVALTAAAIGALAAGSTGGELPGGFVALARNVAGMTGTGLLCAALLGGILAWTGPMAYLVLTERWPEARQRRGSGRAGRRTTWAGRCAPAWCSRPAWCWSRCAGSVSRRGTGPPSHSGRAAISCTRSWPGRSG